MEIIISYSFRNIKYAYGGSFKKTRLSWLFSRNTDMKIMGKRLTFVVRRKREERRRREFQWEKGEGLFLPWIFFPPSSPSFFMIFTEK
jgi:hypothetical protein